MIIFYIVLGVIIIFAVVALLMTPNLFRPSPEAQRFFDVVKTESQRPDQRVIGVREQMQNTLLGAGHRSCACGWAWRRTPSCETG